MTQWYRRYLNNYAAIAIRRPFEHFVTDVNWSMANLQESVAVVVAI